LTALVTNERERGICFLQFVIIFLLNPLQNGNY
jgi:hypothetical protein